jgi:hypothetical protein
MSLKGRVLIFLVLCLTLSCSKNGNEFPDNPKWLNDKIAMMDTANYYFGTKVFLYEWHNEFYYWISVPLSSCMMCEFYNYQGEKYIWTADKSTDFQKNARRLKEVWHRDI